jgi:hypothetical protein
LEMDPEISARLCFMPHSSGCLKVFKNRSFLLERTI